MLKFDVVEVEEDDVEIGDDAKDVIPDVDVEDDQVLVVEDVEDEVQDVDVEDDLDEVEDAGHDVPADGKVPERSKVLDVQNVNVDLSC